MSSYSLADIQRAADEKYGNTIIALADGETATLLNPMRVNKDKRVRLTRIFRSEGIVERLENEPDLDVFDLQREAIQLACKSEHDFAKLQAEVGDDPGVWSIIFAEYNGVSELGEASTSES